MGLGVGRARTLTASREAWNPVLHGPSSPAARSSLAADDAVFTAMGCSAIAWSGVRTAVTAFDRALALLEGEPHGPADGVVSELRTAMVHVSHALAVLSPRRADRIAYALRIAWTAFSGPDERSPSLTALAPFPSPLVVREVQTLLAERGFSASPRWSDLSSVRVATGHLGQRVADPDLLEATVRFMWSADEQEQPVRDDAVACAETVVAMIDRALELWSTRSTPAPALTGDVAESSTELLFTRPPALKVDPFARPVGAGRRRRAV